MVGQHKAMIEREFRDFVRVTRAVQRDLGGTLERAKKDAGLFLDVATPSDDEFKKGLSLPGPKRGRGRPRAITGLSKSEAVAAVAVYFETCGAGREQAITEACRWLGMSLTRKGLQKSASAKYLSRKVAKEAVTAHRLNTGADQIWIQAQWAYRTYRPLTTQPLPDKFVFKRKPRRRKSELG